jgi:hypothetical protein
MNVYFFPKGRLGNAIFRYFACTMFAIKYDATYNIEFPQSYFGMSDNQFASWIYNDLNNIENSIINYTNIVFGDYYQHDKIYKKYKDQIISYIQNHPKHYVLTDGIRPGDGNHEKFYMIDIISNNYTKYYDVVIHLRLDDYAAANLHIKVHHVITLIQKMTITENSCIVVQLPTTQLEKDYIQQIIDKIYEQTGFTIPIESNDTLTDYYIMKNAKTLVCSISSLSWVAALLSTTIEKCYMPNINVQYTCRYPIDNTELYNITD